ncbi:ARMD4 protein, partial [Turnix velox]|nr:ARMD4 protein [Turnix velox]
LHSGLVSLASFWTHLFSAMSRSLGFNICLVTCSILLLLSTPPCLALEVLEEDDLTKAQNGHWIGNGVEDERTDVLNLKNNLSPSEPAVSEEPYGVSAKSSEALLNEAVTVAGEVLSASPNHVIPTIQDLDARTSVMPVAAVNEEELGPTKLELDQGDTFKAMLTTAVTTLSPAVQEDSVGGPISETTIEGAAPSENPLSGTTVEEEAKSSSHPSAVPHPELYLSSPSWETVSDHSGIPAPQAHGMTSEVGTQKASTGSPLRSLATRASVAPKRPLVVTEATLSLEGGTGVRRGGLSATGGTVTSYPVATVPREWDDTKLGSISQGRSASPEEVTEDLGEMEPFQTPLGSVAEQKDVTRVLPSPASPPPTLGLAEETNCTAPVQGEEVAAASTDSGDALHATNLMGVDTADLGSPENINAVTAEEGKSILPSLSEVAVVTDTHSDLSPTPESSWRGVTQEVTTLARETDAALSVVTLAPDATQRTGAANLLQENSGEDTQMTAAASATQMLVTTGSSMARNADVEDLSDVILPTSEKAIPAPGGLPATESGQTEEPPSSTVVLVTPSSMASSVRRTALPPVRKISTAVTYGLDRLESEEVEEEEEDEEEEEEEEEEDEEDKDMDSMDESMEGDTDLPGFTLPEETSQEPLSGLENPVAQLAGVSYQVPDTIEWEQQNQGL